MKTSTLMLPSEHNLKSVLSFGTLGYWRKQGKYYFKPSTKYLHLHFQGITLHQDTDLKRLTEKIINILTVVEVSE